ncbi:uncharacterized protein DNG_09630 [Cephalotrichum gorgonifer]|uniref:Coagulation factor 5/8 type domain-containing protein n=1 Tax=Cephalotrichum gorgonifer TaxID=2041049 RepID=A0AAE8N625_9PEZI|nr:uncharacterized protein DNG_09630 [Cephalotrichum gorgonifer]
MGLVRTIFLFKDVMKSNTTALKTSGFNTLIIFNIGILNNGDIKYYSRTPGSKDVLVASNGAYVGGDALVEKVRSFKTGDTGVNRVEISMNAENVRSLMADPGPKPNTPLYRNFVALKRAWSLDAVNNDDEEIYDMPSTVVFAKMLGEIGYKYTTAPYERKEFWAAVKNEVNKGLQEPLLDRVYLQCYDGGAPNVPGEWQTTLGMKVVPHLWVTNNAKPREGVTSAEAKARFHSWIQKSDLAGGGYWDDYDIEDTKSSYIAYGNVLVSLFP